MKHQYTDEQIRDALHLASVARAGLNITSLFLDRVHWSNAEILDMSAVLEALPETVESCWKTVAASALQEGDTYAVVAPQWEISARVQKIQTVLTHPVEGQDTPRSVQVYSTAAYDPITGQQYTFRDVELHADLQLYKQFLQDPDATDCDMQNDMSENVVQAAHNTVSMAVVEQHLKDQPLTAEEREELWNL